MNSTLSAIVTRPMRHIGPLTGYNDNNTQSATYNLQRRTAPCQQQSHILCNIDAHLQSTATNSTLLATVTHPMQYIGPLTPYSTLLATATHPTQCICPLTIYSNEQHPVSNSHISYAIYRSTCFLRRWTEFSQSKESIILITNTNILIPKTY